MISPAARGPGCAQRRKARQWGAAIVVVFARRGIWLCWGHGRLREDRQTWRVHRAPGMSGKAGCAIRASGVFRVCKAREAPRIAARGDGMMLHRNATHCFRIGNLGLFSGMRPNCREAIGHRQVFRPRRKAALRLRILGRNTTHHTCINLYVRPENTTGAKGRFYRASLLLGPAIMVGGDALGWTRLRTCLVCAGGP